MNSSLQAIEAVAPEYAAKTGSSRAASGAADAAAGQHFCAFWLADRCYALDVVHVGSVFSAIELTRVPQAPPAIRGACNLRGSVLAVVDLARVLDLPGAGSKEHVNRVLVLKSHRLQAGICIDRVETVHAFQQARLKPLDSGQIAIRGVLEFGADFKSIAALLDGQYVMARLEDLKFKSRNSEKRIQTD